MVCKYIYKTFRTGLILYIFLIANISLAGSYQSEIGLAYRSTHSSLSIDSNDKTSTRTVAGVFYLSPIDVEGPLAEAEFISKSSYVTAGLGRKKIDLFGEHFDGDTDLIGFEYRLTGTDILLGANYINNRLYALGYGDYNMQSTTLNIDKYLDDKTLIGLSYESGNHSITGFSDIDISEKAIRAKRLINAINVEARYASYTYDFGTASDRPKIFVQMKC